MTDADDALMAAIAVVFPNTANHLCIWHINKNVAVNCKDYFSNSDWESFLQRWNIVIFSKVRIVVTN